MLIFGLAFFQRGWGDSCPGGGQKQYLQKLEPLEDKVKTLRKHLKTIYAK